MKPFPDEIPVFPLSGVIYFPKTNLPLNIFEQRYLDLVKNHPKIIQSISLKMIASYLGITDVALSRIRSRLSRRGNKSI